MIRSFKNKLTASIDDGSMKKGFPADLVRGAQQLLTHPGCGDHFSRPSVTAR